MNTSDSQLPRALSVSKANEIPRFVGCVGMGVGFFVSTMFVLVGGVLFYGMVILPIVGVISARSWERVPCTVLPPHQLGPQWQYEYEVGRVKFVGDRYSFAEFDGAAPSQDFLHNHFPPGTQTVCYVNPDRPGESVLNRDFVPGMLWGLFPIPFLLIGLVGHGVLLYLWRRRSHRRLMSQADQDLGGSSEQRTVQPPRVVSVARLQNSEFDDESLQEEPGPVTLTAESSPFTNLMVAIIFAVVFNAVVGAFVLSRVGDWLQGRWQWFPELILFPFVLIGLGAIGAVGYCLLALFNPVPSLTMSRRLIPLGGTAELSWQFQGNTRSIQKLSLVLKGVEEARYTRGTDTTTDTEVFYENAFLETDDPDEIEQGSAILTIPTDTMHSFNGGNNRIKWVVAIHGVIPHWPDASASFSIQVVPHE